MIRAICFAGVLAWATAVWADPPDASSPPLPEVHDACYETSYEGCLCLPQDRLLAITSESLAYREALKNPVECAGSGEVTVWGLLSTTALLLVGWFR